MMKALIFLISMMTLIGISTADKLIYAYSCSASGASFPVREIFDWSKGKTKHLSPAGVRQHYILGRELRRRYVDLYKLFDEQYNPPQIYVQSSTVDRAVESAYAQFSGLFVMGTGHIIKADPIREKAVPPNNANYAEWAQNLGTGALNYTYQAFPLIINGGSKDTFLTPEETCVGVTSLVEERAGSKTWTIHQTAISQIMAALRLDPTDVKNITYVSELRDAIWSSLYEGKPFMSEPSIVMLLQDTIRMEQCSRYEFFLDIKSGDKEVSKIMASPILFDVKRRMDIAVNNYINGTTKNDDQKYTMMVGSEKLIAALLKHMQVNEDKKLVPPASVILFEVYKKEKSNEHSYADYYVRYIYNSQINETVSYQEFKDRIAAAIYSEREFNAQCNNDSENKEPSSGIGVIVILIIVGVLVVVGAAFAVIQCIKHRSNNSSDDAGDAVATPDEEKILAEIRKEYEAS